jgi:hypothetical protein
MKPPAPSSRRRFFPLPKGNQVPVQRVQQWLRQVFARWGLPTRLRLDNGWPWGNHNDLPTALALWLWGVGCELLWNRPGRPQSNGVVERFNGLLDQWGEPEQCADLAAWAARLAQVVHWQREAYPAVAGQSRSAAYPALQQNPRRYAAVAPYDQEPEGAWELGRVQAHLERDAWRRRVGKKGQITLYHRPYRVGSAYAGQEVYLRYEAAAAAWVVRNRQGEEIARHGAAEISRERIVGLEISHRKAHERRAAAPRRRARQNLVAHVVT